MSCRLPKIFKMDGMMKYFRTSVIDKMFNFFFFFLDLLHDNQNSPESLKSIFESPKNSSLSVPSSDNIKHSSTKRFVITPVTLKDT